MHALICILSTSHVIQLQSLYTTCQNDTTSLSKTKLFTIVYMMHRFECFQYSIDYMPQYYSVSKNEVQIMHACIYIEKGLPIQHIQLVFYTFSNLCIYTGYNTVVYNTHLFA